MLLSPCLSSSPSPPPACIHKSVPYGISTPPANRFISKYGVFLVEVHLTAKQLHAIHCWILSFLKENNFPTQALDSVNSLQPSVFESSTASPPEDSGDSVFLGKCHVITALNC